MSSLSQPDMIDIVKFRIGLVSLSTIEISANGKIDAF